jgi:hypothetical protein
LSGNPYEVLNRTPGEIRRVEERGSWKFFIADSKCREMVSWEFCRPELPRLHGSPAYFHSQWQGFGPQGCAGEDWHSVHSFALGSVLCVQSHTRGVL